MQVLVAYPFKSEIRNRYQLTYLPELVQDEDSLVLAIREHRPHAIIVGSNVVGKETLEGWRSEMGNGSHLTLIRRGSALSRIAIHHAKQLDISVVNTLSVNSRFVAEYIIEALELPGEGFCAIVAIIGSGAIGSRVAQRLSAAHHNITIYSPSLTTPNKSDLERIRQRKGIALENIHVALTPEEAIVNATHVVIAVDADRIIDVSQQISRQFFELIPNGARLVSVTEFRAFAEGALSIFVERIRQGQLMGLLDSPAYDLITIRDPPRGLKAISAGMKGVGCGEAMDQAALVVLANVALEQSFGSPLSYYIISAGNREKVTVVGAGITGLLCALMLVRDGYEVMVVDEHARPILNAESPSNQIFCKGTIDGCDARHASVTETMPHALFYRQDSFNRGPRDRGGWKVIDGNFEARERAWIERFIQLGGHPELVVNIFTQFVANINRRGLKIWEELFSMIPELNNAVNTRRLIRICPDAVSFNVVYPYQSKYHKNEDLIVPLTRAQVLERLPGLVLTDSDAAGVEIPGFGVNVQKLSSILIDYLEQKEKVIFQWSTQVKTLHHLSSKVVLASELGRIDSDLVDVVSLAVEGVVGCWIKLPNVNSIKNAFKISEKEPLSVINVTPSVDGQNLFVTGGFGFTGQREYFYSRRLDQFIKLFYETIRHYLPEEIEAGELEMRIPKLCFRPMTPDGMPIVTELSNGNNSKQQVYYVGGTNAGGFVEAPLLATLLIDLIRGPTNESSLCHVYRALSADRDTLQLKVT